MKNQYIILIFCLMAMFITGANPALSQGAWNQLPPMPTPAGFLSAVSYDGKIYLFGGASPNHTAATKKAHVFNPADSSYTPLPDMPQPTSSAGVVEVDGKIYVMGGSNAVLGDQFYNTNYVFDPATMTWDTAPPMPRQRFLFAIAAVEKKIYVIGGGINEAVPVKLVDVYDTETKSWSAGVDLPAAKGFLASAVADGKIYVFGGTVDVYGIGLSTVHIFDPNTDKWTAGEPMPTKRFGAAALELDGEIYVLGGSSLDKPDPYFHTAEKFDPESGKWNSLPSMLTGARGRAAAAVGGKIYAFGGMYTVDGLSIISANAAEVYNTTISAADLTKTFKISVFPNPASERVIFRFETPVSGQVTFTRPDGMIVYSKNIRGEQQVEIPAAGLPEGMLFWKFEAINGGVVSDKIFIIR